MLIAPIPTGLPSDAIATVAPTLTFGLLMVVAPIVGAVTLLLLIEWFALQAGRPRRERDLTTGAVNCGERGAHPGRFQAMVRARARPHRR